MCFLCPACPVNPCDPLVKFIWTYEQKFEARVSEMRPAPIAHMASPHRYRILFPLLFSEVSSRVSADPCPRLHPELLTALLPSPVPHFLRNTSVLSFSSASSPSSPVLDGALLCKAQTGLYLAM